MDFSSWRTRLLSYCLMKGLTMASVLKAAVAMAMAAVQAAVAAVLLESRDTIQRRRSTH